MSSNEQYLLEKCLYRLKSLVNEAGRILICLNKCSLQKVLLAGLRIRDLVNHQSNSALGNNVRHTISQLDRYHCLGRREAEHWEQVHNWVCAPTDHSHDLGCANLRWPWRPQDRQAARRRCTKRKTWRRTNIPIVGS